MKKELTLHFLYLLPFFALIIVLNSWFDVSTIVLFFLGGVLGSFLPYVDYLIYAYAIKQKDPMTVEVFNKNNILATVKQYYSDKTIAADLVFHTALFQALLLVFVFFVVSSTGSMFARGIVLAFAVHLLLDQVIDYQRDKNADSWFLKFPLILDNYQKKLFIIVNAILIFFLGVFF